MIGLGSQSQLGIGIAIQLRDQFSTTADKVTRKLVDMKKQSNAVLDSALRGYRNNTAMLSAASTGIALGFYKMAKGASEFGHQINAMDILGDGKLGRTKKQLTDFTLKMATDFATMPSKVGDLMTDNIRQGVNKGLSMVTEYQMAVSKATNETPEAVGKSLLGIMHAYNMTTAEFPRIANAVTATANATQSSVYSIGESMEYTGFTARRLNLDLEHTLAFLGKLSQSGIMGSSAGVAMNQMQLELAKGLGVGAPKKKIKAWQMLGLDRGTMKGYMNEANGLFKVSAAIEKASSRINSVDREKILFDLLGVRGAKGLSGAWGASDPSKSLGGLLAATQAGVSGDVSRGQARRMMNDPYSQFLRIQVKWEVFKIRFISSMAPVLSKILRFGEKIIDFATVIGASPIGQVFGTIVAVGAPIIGLLLAFQSAVLTATIALRGYGALGIGGRPGFGSLVGAGLGSIVPKAPSRGFGVFASSAPGYLGQIGKNAAGAWHVRAGQQFNVGGKLYGAGQLLPRGFNPAMGGFLHPQFNNLARNSAGNWHVAAGKTFTWEGKSYGAGSMVPRSINPMAGMMGLSAGASLASSGGTGIMSKLGTYLGTGVGSKVLPTLGKIAGYAGRMLPILGWGITLYSIYDLLRSNNSKDNREEKPEDPAYQQFKRSMDSSFWGQSGQNWRANDKFLKSSSDKTNAMLNQQIAIYMDGKKVMEENMKQALDQSMQNYLPFNLQY